MVDYLSSQSDWAGYQVSTQREGADPFSVSRLPDASWRNGLAFGRMVLASVIQFHQISTVAHQRHGLLGLTFGCRYSAFGRASM